MVDPVRDLAVKLLLDVEEGIPLSGPLDAALARCEPAQRARLRALVTEAIRHRARLDHVVGACLARGGIDALDAPLRQVLRLGAAERLVLSGVPDHALVHAWVEIALHHGHKGTAGLANAVLRRVLREGADRWESAGRDQGGAEAMALRHSHPVWLVERWVERWGRERVERMLEWNQSTPDYWIRMAPGATPPGGAVAGWIPGALRLPAGSRPHEDTAFAEGGYTVQDGSSIVVGHLAPEARGRILDLCAAPGTKTGHLLERGDATIRLVAADRSPGRLRRMRRGLERLGRAEAVQLLAADGRMPAWRAGFDGALVDAPCTNLGVIRRRVDVRWRVRPEEVDRLAAVQRSLLDAAAAAIAPGGWLVYSVCTIEPEETTEQRVAFLDDHPGWSPVPLPEWIPRQARGEEGELILLPGDLETDGGYAFVLRRGAT